MFVKRLLVMPVKGLSLTIDGICFLDTLIASGRVKNNPSKISKTTERMTMQFWPDVELHQKEENKKKMDVNHLVCKLWVSRVQKHSNILFSGYATSEHGNFIKCYWINDINIEIGPNYHKAFTWIEVSFSQAGKHVGHFSISQ